MSDIDYLNQLRSDFLRLAHADEASRPASGPVLRRVARHRYLRRPLAAAAVGIAACALVGLGWVWAASRSDTSHPTVGIGPNSHAPVIIGIAPAPVGTDPFGSPSRAVSLAEARSLVDFPLPVPNSELAGPQNLSNVWYSTWKNDDGTTAREVILDYVSSDIRIMIQRAVGFPADPLAGYAETARSMDQPASSAHLVDGAPALVIDAANGKGGFVDMDRNGIHIVIMGPYSADQLTQIAGTLQP